MHQYSKQICTCAIQIFESRSIRALTTRRDGVVKYLIFIGTIVIADEGRIPYMKMLCFFLYNSKQKC